jgi:hypothetical protein
MGLQTRLQMRFFGKIEFFERPDGFSSHSNGGTFDHHFAYQISPKRTYNITYSFNIYIKL